LNYQTEKESVKLFKHQLEEYNDIFGIYQAKKNDYEELYFNKEISDKIGEKKNKIFELQERMRKMLEQHKQSHSESSAKHSMYDIIMFYNDELLPEYHNLQELKYPFKCVEITGGEPETPIFTVFQKSIGFNKIDYSYGEREPEVIAYVI